MAKPVDWIGPFIEAELAAVIAWWKSDEAPRDATNNADSRFENGGSNFRSAVKFSTLHVEPLVQISEVVSCKAPVVIIITDGHTQIRAKLSNTAAQVLESEIGEDIDAETKGDVISIKNAIVASTPYGPQDEHVQLEIQEIEYMYHLRKSLGQRHTILERAEAARLLSEITEMRSRQYDILENQAAPVSIRANANAVAGASRNSDRTQANEIPSPQSQQSMSPPHSSQLAVSQPSYGTQPSIATQLPLSRKRKAPTMVEDGLEILQGNNLARPHGPGFASPTTRPSSAKRPQFGNDETTLRILNLLGNQPKNVPLQTSPTVVEQLPAQSEPRSMPSSPTAPANVHDISGEVEHMSIAGAEEPSAPAVDQSTAGKRMPSHSVPQKYSFRRIPVDQRSLLEKQDSWVPSLPGKRFPQPNIPLELLEQWHVQAELDNPKMAQTDRTTAETTMETSDSSQSVDARIVQAKPTTVETTIATSDSSSESSEDELLAGSWPPTPSQRLPQLPPDSTIGSNNQTSPLGKRTQMQRVTSQSALQEKEQLPPDSSMGSSIHSSPVTKQTQQSLGGSHNSQSALQERERLPPNSSTGSSEHSSSVEKQTQRSMDCSHLSKTKSQQMPQHSAIHNIARGSQAKEQLPPAGSIGSSNHSSPLMKQTQRSSVGSHTSPMRTQQVRKHGTIQSSARGSASSGNGDQHALEGSQCTSPNRMQLQENGTTARVERTPQSKVKAQRTPDKLNQASRPSASGSIVQGTQLQSESDVEMEMGVPRSLERKPEQNPSIAHRRERSIHLKHMQRMHW
jgi:hypothetical protein